MRNSCCESTALAMPVPPVLNPTITKTSPLATSITSEMKEGKSNNENINTSEVSPMRKALTKARGDALRGGLAGATAQVFNVGALMWMRTTMNYQYRHGGTTRATIRALYAEGGVMRFYRGVIPALMQSPLSRFGDTAANVGVLTFLEQNEQTRFLPIGVKTMIASCGAASWRLVLMPLDAWKTTKQVEGKDGVRHLMQKVGRHGPSKLYHGSLAAMGATWVGHYPWFFTHNYLNHHVPLFEFDGGKYVRSALIGFCSSVVSDSCSNSIRVVKTTRQTSQTPMTYPNVVKAVVAKDGVVGLFGRGLSTRIATNGLQGMLFSVGWRTIQDWMKPKEDQ
eukprot:GHVN01023087.1.p1 GENE.GHVN01023087.1~~GHVN01023087.1.p1  ORF type:complete len:337 (+),score=53.24 GHVN01023087.1:632-1642(+)